MFQRRESAQRFAENRVADYGRDDANRSYAWVALYTLNFLDANLKDDDGSAKAFLGRTPLKWGCEALYGYQVKSCAETV